MKVPSHTRERGGVYENIPIQVSERGKNSLKALTLSPHIQAAAMEFRI